jgi:hypothetical protein
MSNKNQGLVSRLPYWIKKSKNRESISKCIQKSKLICIKLRGLLEKIRLVYLQNITDNIFVEEEE